MKHLILIRHAKSSWDNRGLKDIDRPLNARGERDAPFMGTLLEGKNIKPELILSSPAVRALSTAKIFADKLLYDPDKIKVMNSLYEASRSDLLIASSLTEDNIHTVLLFGHNPGLTLFSNYLTGEYISNIPTCGIVILHYPGKWNELNEKSCILAEYEYPKKYLK